MTTTLASSHATAASSSSHSLVYDIARSAKQSCPALLQASDDTIVSLLLDLAARIRSGADVILSANQRDLDAAAQRGLSGAMLDRLTLNEARIEGIAAGVEAVAALPDPVGRVLWSTERPNGLRIERVSVPIGVLGMIYESRPNVTVDAAVLCLRSRNCVVLRGGSESLNSSLALHGFIQESLTAHGLPMACVSMIPVADRDAVGAMLSCHDYIDVMIPRGGRSLIERVMHEARMPVFGHLEGLCHIYIHPSAKPDLARSVVLNAKMRRTGVCGAVETLLLDRALSPEVAQSVVLALLEAGCAVAGDDAAQRLDARILPATEQDWVTEYLDAKISIATVDGVEGAIHHINHYGSHHTDSILAEDQAAVDAFLQRVDSGIVMHNASTQFADGGEFGMGAEIGIATGKMHARGPVGLEQLCTYKYRVLGGGQTRP